MGVSLEIKESVKILEDLGFKVTTKEDLLKVEVPSWRVDDVSLPEDIIEEVARVYGYFKLPSILPYQTEQTPYSRANDQFYWEQRAREALKYWGFTELFTYPMVSESMLEGPTTEAVSIKNPLSEDNVHMRRTLVPSLLEAVRENKNREALAIFEISNAYIKQKQGLPKELLKLAGIYKKPKASFFDVKGIIEALLQDLGISDVEFKKAESGAVGADVYIGHDLLGEIEVLEQNLIDFELDFGTILKHASLKKVYKPTSKFPESVEDLRFEIDPDILYSKIEKTILGESSLVKSVSLLDVYQNKKTFRIVYQSQNHNLTNEEITEVRERIIAALKKSFKATLA
ncbi:MAG TPA: hypothetical protein VHE53_02265, partial [Patescibacteria group bacterium]|nr:hypothetical protein [Patescibacteria group bacterium]